MNSQKEKVKQMLENWVCSTDFQTAYIPEYRSRINDLRKMGLKIEKRYCQNPNHRHNSTRIQEWRLTPKMTLGTAKNPQGITSQEFFKRFPSQEKVTIKASPGLW